MIITNTYADKRVIVLGLGKSGLSAANALRMGGAQVWVWDDVEATRSGVTDYPVLNPQTVQWRDYDALVLAPGIPFTHPEPHPAVRMAQAAQRPVIGDIEVFAQVGLPAKVIGITGTNGKSTTTALIGHILDQGTRSSAIGGNIGVPALELPALGPTGIYALELSSFQIDLAPSLSLDVAVLLNISPDHLDRHGTMENYAAVKAKILHQQGDQAMAVVSLDDPYCAGIAQSLISAGRRVIGISTQQVVDDGVYVHEGQLVDSIHGVPHALLDLRTLKRMPGQHNWQNVLAAYAAVRAAGLGTSEAADALSTFPGLAHRQEFVAMIDGVQLINDSKATNVEATIKALNCYRKIHWLVGGRRKATGLDGVHAHLGAVEAAYTFGEVTEDFADHLTGHVPNVEMCGLMSTALERAFAAAKQHATAEEPATVLLSPACASFDQFRSFEERGDVFRSLVGIFSGQGVSVAQAGVA